MKTILIEGFQDHGQGVLAAAGAAANECSEYRTFVLILAIVIVLMIVPAVIGMNILYDKGIWRVK